MKVVLILILVLTTTAFAQSGRRKIAVPTPTPTPALEEKPAATPPRSQVTAERDQDYSCTSDGTLAHLLDPPDVAGFSQKEVDVKAEITAKPNPVYTREARRMNVEGVVTLKVLLLANGKIDRVRVVRRLPFGLTENAILAACEIKFKPAMKAGKEVSQWLTVQYGFKLTSSSIFRP